MVCHSDACSFAVAFISVKIVLITHKSLFIYYLYYLDGQAVPKNITNLQENTFNRVRYITVAGQMAGNIIKKDLHHRYFLVKFVKFSSKSFRRPLLG